MTDKELKLLQLINENDNKEEAILTAMDIILSFLEQPQSFEEQAPVYLPGLVEIS
jgi:hypothetical protein